MKNKLLLFVLTWVSICPIVHGQEVYTEEQRLKYADAILVVNICKYNEPVDFNDSLEYYWYTDFSGIQITKGGSGGQLLHGKFRMYNLDGKLKQEKNFNLGLLNGECKIWDSLGNIIETSKYSNGTQSYVKYIDEEGYYIEWIGGIFTPGLIKNVYDKSGRWLLSKEVFKTIFEVTVTIYYEHSTQVMEIFSYSILPENLVGEYKSFYSDGKPKETGMYENGNRTGVWFIHSDSGESSIAIYRIKKEFYPNGELKSRGSEYYGDSEERWYRDGKWYFYNTNGSFKEKKMFSFGAEITDE